MYKGLRTFSSLSRTILRSRRSPIYPSDGVIKIQRVHLVRPFFTKRRLQTALLWSTAFMVYWYTIGSIEDEENEEQPAGQIAEAVVDEQEVDEDGEFVNPEESPEDAWFIPLWFAKQCPPIYYKSEDPEWQSFRKFAKDRAKLEAVQRELADSAAHHLNHLKGFQNAIGTPMKVNKYWLVFDFPEGPPPQYERPGIEITDNGATYAVREVDPVNLERLRRVMWPKPILDSLWASYISHWSLRLARIKDFFNIEASDSQSRISPLNVDFRQLAQAQDKNSPQTTSGQEVQDESETKTLPAPKQLPSPVDTKRSEDAEMNKILRPLQAIPQPGGEMNSVLATFKKMLRRAWRPLPVAPPRGTVILSGLVEITGPRATCMLDVLGAYHPEESRFVAQAMHVRRLQPRRQYPRDSRARPS